LIDVEKISAMGAGESEIIINRGTKFIIEKVDLIEGEGKRVLMKYLLRVVD
jgi:hypothetical protein